MFLEEIAKLTPLPSGLPEIFHLFQFRPAAGKHLAAFTQEIMRGDSELSPGLRELIAAYTSKQNGCHY
jgi:alkylhydroperoxidase family enzyme